MAPATVLVGLLWKALEELVTKAVDEGVSVLENRLSQALLKGVNGLLPSIDLNEIRYKNNEQLLCNFYFDETQSSGSHILLKGVIKFCQYFIQRE